MKLNKKLSLTFECTLDSSEAIMFDKGGLHTAECEDLASLPWDMIDDCQITFQIEPECLARHKFIRSSHHPTTGKENE